MMKFVSDSIIKRGVLRSSISRVSWYWRSARPPNLYKELSRCYRQKISVTPVLDEWFAQGGDMRQQTLQLFINDFLRRRRFIAALEIVEWMSHRRNIYAINPDLAAVHLDLLYKVHGIEPVEKYFNGLEDSLVDYPVYEALLSCYAQARRVAQAEATMNYIRKFDSCRLSPYNSMLMLYSHKQMHEELDALVQEMQDKGIPYNKDTYFVVIKAYARADVERMDKLMEKMESDDTITVDFRTYVAAAKAYFGAGVLDKAFECLKKAESCSACKSMKLMVSYASLQKKEDVYRILNQYLNSAEVDAEAYTGMINSLRKLDDLDGIRKIFDKWEGTRTTSSSNLIPDLVIRAYCIKGDMGNAEIIMKKLVDTGGELQFRTLRHMALGYIKNGQMEKAVEMTKKTLLLSSLPGKEPNLMVVETCLEYLQNKGDADGMQEILVLLEKYGRYSSDVKEVIGRFFSDGKPKTKNGNGTAAIKEFYVPLFTASTAGSN